MFDFFAEKGFRKYLKEARRILDGNWTGRYTKPSPSLYPHQWNWDSGFIAIGYAHYHQRRAMQELRSLFEHQWENGMVPQIAFNPDSLGHYFPEPNFWQAPDGRLTSGITMPPLHATAALHIWEHASDRELAKEFLDEMFQHLMTLHRYFYHYRDPERTGLVYIRHPWESGLDNSPNWDGPLRNIEVDPGQLPPYERKDLEHGIPAEQRPTQITTGTSIWSICSEGTSTTRNAFTGNVPFLFRTSCSTPSSAGPVGIWWRSAPLSARTPEKPKNGSNRPAARSGNDYGRRNALSSIRSTSSPGISSKPQRLRVSCLSIPFPRHGNRRISCMND